MLKKGRHLQFKKVELNVLTISIHGIELHAKVGMYPEEKISGNDFEIDVDVFADVKHSEAFPFIDYTIINEIVISSFKKPGELLETFAKDILETIHNKFPEATKVKVVIRKLNPPMAGKVKYSQVIFES